jgi:hypothetical protein
MVGHPEEGNGARKVALPDIGAAHAALPLLLDRAAPLHWARNAIPEVRLSSWQRVANDREGTQPLTEHDDRVRIVRLEV